MFPDVTGCLDIPEVVWETTNPDWGHAVPPAGVNVLSPPAACLNGSAGSTYLSPYWFGLNYRTGKEARVSLLLSVTPHTAPTRQNMTIHLKNVKKKKIVQQGRLTGNVQYCRFNFDTSF